MGCTTRQLTARLPPRRPASLRRASRAGRRRRASSFHRTVIAVRRKTRPPTGPVSRGRSTPWALRRRRGRLQGGRRHPARLGRAEHGRLTGPLSRGRLTTWETSTGRRSASPTPRPPTTRRSASGARWQHRTRPPTGPTSRRRLTTWAFFTGPRTASPAPRPPTRRPSASGASSRRRTRPPTGPISLRRSTACAFFTGLRTASPTPRPP